MYALDRVFQWLGAGWHPAPAVRREVARDELVYGVGVSLDEDIVDETPDENLAFVRSHPVILRRFREYFACRRNAVERRWKTGVDRHLLEDVHDLLARGACRSRRPQMPFQRGRLCADSGEKRDGRQLARQRIERSLPVAAAARRPEVSPGDSLELIDLSLPRADVECRLDVPFQLRLRVPESAQCGNGTELTRPKVETGT
jgi:hypothetical protein